MSDLISSLGNPQVKQIRSLSQKKWREETGLFLVEGIFHVGEAVEAGWKIETLVYSPELLSSEYARTLVEEQNRRGVRSLALTRELFTAIAEKDNPQGILAAVHQRYVSLDEVSIEQLNFGVALVSPQDPGNVGTILRTLDAVGVGGLILLDGGVELYHPSVVRASMGTLFWKIVVQAPFSEFILWKQKQGYQLVGSSAHAKTDYREYERGNSPTILLLGNEQKGLSTEQCSACDVVLSLPMKGRVSSLNLGVAAGILLYQMLEIK